MFGPESSEAIDMMHLGVHFIDCMHDTDVSLVQLLRQKGDRIMYTYGTWAWRDATRRDVHVDGMLWNLISSHLASFLSSPTML